MFSLRMSFSDNRQNRLQLLFLQAEFRRRIKVLNVLHQWNFQIMWQLTKLEKKTQVQVIESFEKLSHKKKKTVQSFRQNWKIFYEEHSKRWRRKVFIVEQVKALLHCSLGRTLCKPKSFRESYLLYQKRNEQSQIEYWAGKIWGKFRFNFFNEFHVCLSSFWFQFLRIG